MPLLFPLLFFLGLDKGINDSSRPLVEGELVALAYRRDTVELAKQALHERSQRQTVALADIGAAVEFVGRT